MRKRPRPEAPVFCFRGDDGNRERVIARTLGFATTSEARFSRVVFCRIRSGFIHIDHVRLPGRGRPLRPLFREAKAVNRFPGLIRRAASTSRVVRHGCVHRCLTGKVGKGYSKPSFCFSRPRPRIPDSWFEDEGRGRGRRTKDERMRRRGRGRKELSLRENAEENYLEG